MKRSTAASFLTLVLLLVLVFPVFAQAGNPPAPPTPAIPETVLLIIPILTGSIGIPLINFFKKQFGWVNPEDKIKNVWLSFLISFALAILALVATNSLVPMTGPETLIIWVLLAFSTATLIYKSMQPVQS